MNYRIYIIPNNQISGGENNGGDETIGGWDKYSCICRLS